MTPRERLLCVLHGELPDRVPVSPFVQETYLSYFLKKAKTDRLLDAKTVADTLDFDLMSRINRFVIPAMMTRSAPNWDVSVEIKIENGICKRSQTIVTPARMLRQIEAAPNEPGKLGGAHFTTTEYLIKDSDDFEAFRKYMPLVDAEYENEFLEYAKFAKRYIGARGVTAPWSIASVYNLASRYINVQDMMMDALTDEDYYHSYMTFFAGLCQDNVELFTRSEFDCVGILGNIANGAMMGSDFFSEHVAPYEKIPLVVAKDAGLPTIYHNCGSAKNLYACYKDLGISVWETVAMLPQGDNNLKEAKAFFGDTLILCGTLDQVRFLKEATPEEVRTFTQKVVATGKPSGHYIFSCSDFLEENTPLENVMVMLETVKTTGVY